MRPLRKAQTPLLITLCLISASGFLWPFFVSSYGASDKASWFFFIAAPLTVIALVYSINLNPLDSKTIAILAVLTAVIAAFRPLGAGAIGIEPMWFILILAARVFGPYFGFILGATSMVLSALLTGGIGPWLSYQVFAAAGIGVGVAIIPTKLRGRLEVLVLAIYSIIACELFGIAMDLQFWPWSLGRGTQLSYIPGAPLSTNLGHFFTYHFTASMAWDIPRAIFTSILIVVAAPSVLNTLRRAYVKAAFNPEVKFVKSKLTNV